MLEGCGRRPKTIGSFRPPVLVGCEVGASLFIDGHREVPGDRDINQQPSGEMHCSKKGDGTNASKIVSTIFSRFCDLH